MSLVELPDITRYIENDGPVLLNDEYYMRAALRCAERAAEAGEVPIGAVAVMDGRIIARAWNQVEMLKDATAHAEILLISSISGILKDWRMDNVDIYVTKEPCAMCAGAMVNARVRRVIFGLPDPRSGAAGGALDITGFPGMLHQVEVKSGVLAEDCGKIIRDFFRTVRSSDKK